MPPTNRMQRRIGFCLLSCLLLSVVLLFLPGTAMAQDEPPPDDLALASAYAPALYFHPSELFRPQSVDVLIDTARLRQSRSSWLAINVLPHVSIADLLGYGDESYALDAWYGNTGASDFINYTSHRAYYQVALSPDAGGPPIVVYAHVVRHEDQHHITIQYWLFYYYNDWFNKHEGDWEMVEVVLGEKGNPQWVVLSQHHGGTRRPWRVMQLVEDTHPAVYVALGSHASYFVGDEVYPNGMTVGNVRVEIMDRTGTLGPVIPQIVLIPSSEEVVADPVRWSGLEWLAYGGHWGEQGPQGDFSGPLGPSTKGEQWEEPYRWGMAQPLDSQVWYQNRLRVEIEGAGAGRGQVALLDAAGEALPCAESMGSVALLHRDPAPGEDFRAEIQVPPGFPFALRVSWPDPDTSSVTHTTFSGLWAGESGCASVRLQAGEAPQVTLPEETGEITAASREVQSATWDAPDLVWIAGILPATDVLRGLGLSMLATVVPTMLYVGTLYWADRYEKEPKRLLASAFLWGAIPAILVALAVRVFFRLPPELLGPKAIEALQTGLVAPLMEEALKGAVVLWIAWRYRMEFDDVLDGIVYGAMAGFGFAMTGNALSYLGAFLLRGFSGLSNTIFVQGVLYGLNHAMYSAIFGAGLGYARLARKRWQRWAVPLAAFVLSVVVHAVHNLVLQNSMGLNPFTVLITWGGVLVIVVVMVLALRRQKRSLIEELPGEIPEQLYQSMISGDLRRKAYWSALRRGGLRGWRTMRRTNQLCAELAQKKMQYRLRPEDAAVGEEMARLRNELGAMVAKWRRLADH